MASKAHAVMAGAAWTYGAQVGTVAAQFCYAAITSRSVDANGFGAYAIALMVSGFVGLIANGGLGQTVARMTTLRAETLRSLLTFALLLGIIAAIFLFATAGLWAHIWGVPSASDPIRACAVAALLAPVLGLSSGLIRRLGRFRHLALATLVTNLCGFITGALAVRLFHNATSLLVSPLVAQVLLTFTLLWLSRHYLGSLASLRASKGHLRFSWQVTIQNLGSWLTNNLSPWALSHLFGAFILGQWNRSEVLTTVPFNQVQTAMVQAVYPEFRHDIDGSSRARRVWPDLLGLAAWLAFPLAGVTAVVAPVATPVLFGEGWDLAAAYSPLLAVIAGLRMVRVLLGAAVEALGRYRWMWLGIGLEFVGACVGVSIAVWTHSVWSVFAGMGVGVLAAHLAHILVCTRAGYIDLRVVARHYIGAIIGAVGASGAAALLIFSSRHYRDMPWFVAGMLLLMLFGVVGISLHAKSLPPLKIALAHGLVPSRHASETQT